MACVFFFQFFMVAVGFKLEDLIIFFVVAGSCTADGNLLQPTACVNHPPHTSPSLSCLCALIMMSHTTLAQVFVRHFICVSCAWVFVLTSLRSPLCTHHLSLPSTTSPSWTLTSTLSSSMWMSSEQDLLCTSPSEESGPLAKNAPLTLSHSRSWLWQSLRRTLIKEKVREKTLEISKTWTWTKTFEIPECPRVSDFSARTSSQIITARCPFVSRRTKKRSVLASHELERCPLVQFCFDKGHSSGHGG